MKAVILRFNLPAIVIPIEEVKTISPYGEPLLSVELATGEIYLSYHIKFED